MRNLSKIVSVHLYRSTRLISLSTISDRHVLALGLVSPFSWCLCLCFGPREPVKTYLLVHAWCKPVTHLSGRCSTISDLSPSYPRRRLNLIDTHRPSTAKLQTGCFKLRSSSVTHAQQCWNPKEDCDEILGGCSVDKPRQSVFFCMIPLLPHVSFNYLELERHRNLPLSYPAPRCVHMPRG